MTLFMRDQENIEIGREEGRKEGRIEGQKEGRAEGGITTLINLYEELGFSRADTKAKILEKFSISGAKAEEYLEKYWKSE